MNNLKVIKGNRKIEFFSKTIRIPINGELRKYIVIFEKNKKSVHEFTDFFYDRFGYGFCLKNKAYNTIKHYYETFIIRFLNFIFNDSNYKINKIEDLRLDTVEEFLEKFSAGTLPNDRDGEWKSRDTVNRANYAVSYFVYWLWWKKEHDSNKKRFRLKYIKETDFNFSIKTKYSKNGYSTRDTKHLTNIVTPDVSNKIRIKEKVVSASEYGIEKLIEISQKNDPMLTFGIVLGAYLGLRVGDIVQMHRGRIFGLETRKFGVYFDLTSNEILRSDMIETGSIKTKRHVPVYPGCSRILKHFYLKHLEYLKEKGLEANKYSAIFLNRNGMAMTSDVYFYRFRKLRNILYEKVSIDAVRGNKEAIKEREILIENKITPHSLRHFYKQLIESAEENRRITQYFLAHASIESQDSYAPKYTEEGIRKVQNTIYKQVGIKINE